MGLHSVIWIWGIVFLFSWRSSEAVPCGSNSFVGPADVTGFGQKDTNTDRGFLMNAPDDEYKFHCCGRLKSWNVRRKSVTGSVYLQVWRQSGTNWQLIYQVEHQVTATNSDTDVVNVPSANQILVGNGHVEVIGMYFPNQIPVTTAVGQQYTYTSTASIHSPGVGNTVDWSGETTTTGDYGVNAVVDGGNVPTFTNLGVTLTISDTDPAGTSIITLTATDVDVQDTMSYSMTTSTLYFDFDPNTRHVKTRSVIVSGSYSLTFNASDDCENIGNGILTITVTNSPPVINNLVGASASIRQDVTSETPLWTIDVTDASPSDFVECTVVSSVPASADFFTQLNSSTLDWVITSASFPTLTSNSYALQIDCTDGIVTTSGAFTVNIVQNSPPVFSNLANSTTIASSSTAIGDVIFTVSATDADDTQLFYNMTTSPATTSFEVFSNGEVIAKTPITGSTTVYSLSMYVYDSYSLVGPEILNINIADINSDPVISNIPATKTLSENQALGASVFQTSVTDSNAGQSHLYTAVFTPDSGRRLFNLDLQTGLVSTSNTRNINFDTLTGATVTIAITASDGAASDTENLVITIQNVNEAPQFEKTLYTVSGDEGNAGNSFGNPGFVVIDEDTGDSHTFSIDCPTFSMDPTTGVVTLAQAYDLDVTGTASSVTCTVTVQDAALSGTTSLSITIDYINDNSPVFTSSTYTFYVSNSTEIGYTFGTVSASDADIGNDGVFYYSLVTHNASTGYFDLDGDGSFYVKQNISSLEDGDAYLFSVMATDTGGLTNTASVTVIITSVPITTTTTTTDRYREFIEDPDNVVWVICTSTFGVLFVLVVLYTAHRYDFITYVKRFCQKLAERCRKYCKPDDFDTDSIDGHSYIRSDTTISERPPPSPKVTTERPVQMWDFWNTGAQL